MKHLLSLFLIVTLILSCSTGDNPETDPQEPIIGTWGPVTFAQFPENGEPIIESIDECGRKTKITFKANGELINVYYGQDHGECTSDTYFQTWEKISSGSYLFREQQTNHNGQTSSYTISPDVISFPDSNTMRIRYDGNYDEETELNYWYNEFKRK